MRCPDIENSSEEEDHWIGLSDLERERFERHADFLIDPSIRTPWRSRSPGNCETPLSPRDSSTRTVAAQGAQ
jgi:hypothetical protein